jgi:hypothetical protein
MQSIYVVLYIPLMRLFKIIFNHYYTPKELLRDFVLDIDY